MEQTPGPVQVAVQWRHSPPSGPHGSTPQRTPSSSWQSHPGSSPLLSHLHLLLMYVCTCVRVFVHACVAHVSVCVCVWGVWVCMCVRERERVHVYMK